MNTIALVEYLKILEPFLADESINEILINQPGKIFIERKGILEEHLLKDLTFRHLEGMVNLIARFTEQRVSHEEPLLSATLPAGHRIQVVLPPACSQGTVIVSIRKQVIKDVSLDDLASLGLFQQAQPRILKHPRNQNLGHLSEEDGILQELFAKADYLTFLKNAIVFKKNIIISGATSTGKTTLLNACLKEIPDNEHLITLEDVPELRPPQALHTALFSSKGEQGVAKVTPQQLIQASLRLRPDRIIMGELRGREAADFIHATATGHDGSLSSVHAANPLIAFMRLTHMVKLNPEMNLSREDILEDLHTVIDVIVQVKRVREGEQYKRIISELYYVYAKGNKDVKNE
jgi:type IV secretion system protein VirB11